MVAIEVRRHIIVVVAVVSLHVEVQASPRKSITELG